MENSGVEDRHTAIFMVSKDMDAPAWRHIKMLATLVDDTGNRVMIDGFYDDIVPLTEAEEAILMEAAEDFDVEVAAERLGVARFISDDPYEVQKMSRYGQSMNLDGIWAGNMFEEGRVPFFRIGLFKA